MANNIISTILGTGRIKLVKWTDDALKAFNPPSGINSPIPGAASSLSSNQVGAIASAALLKALTVFSTDNACAIGTSGETVYCEYQRKIIVNGKSTEQIDCVKYDIDTGNLQACIVREVLGEKEYSKYIFSDTDGDGIAIILALLPCFIQGTEAEDILGQVDAQIKDPSTADADFFKKIAILTDNFIARTESGYTGENPIKIGNSNSISFLTENIAASSFIDSVLGGTFKILGNGKKAGGPVPSGDKLNGMYAFGNLNYPIAPAMLGKSYLPPEEIMDALEDIKVANGNLKKIRTLLIRGPVGSGKTAGAYAIAAATGKPYVTLVGGPDTSAETTFGSFAPRTRNESVADIPTFEEMQLEPEESYFRLTGHTLADGQTTDIGELFTLSLNKAQEAVSKDTQFDFIESDIILGLKNGWCVEIQEIDKITNPGVLTQLNNLIEFGYVKLPNGEVVYRHEDSVLVFTMNTECVASRPIDQSVISRCDEVIDLETPTMEELVKRAMVRTGCIDKQLAIELATRVLRVSEFCKDQGITDGSCGFRELISWLSVCMAGRDPEDTQDRFLIQKATANKEDQANIRSMLEGSPLN